jgi:hypothetical protein
LKFFALISGGRGVNDSHIIEVLLQSSGEFSNFIAEGVYLKADSLLV